MVKRTRTVSVAACAAIGFFGMARAQDPATAPLPAVTAMATPGMCVVEGWEYAGRWNPANNDNQIPDLEECAAACAADELCTGATHIQWLKNNPLPTCWFKQWGPGPTAYPCEPTADMTQDKEYHAIIKPPPGKTCDDLEFMAEGPFSCPSEVEAYPEGSGMSTEPIGVAGGGAAAPTAVATPPAAAPTMVGETDPDMLAELGYTIHTGFDYGPKQVPAPPAGAITDLPPGTIEMDAVACAERCTAAAAEGCNAFSWYGDNAQETWPGGFNCFIKVLNGCELPADAEVKDDKTAFVIGACADGPTGLPLAPAAAPAVAPTAVPVAPIAATPPTDVGTRDFGFPSPAVPPLGTDELPSDDGGFGTPVPTAAPAPLGTPVTPISGTSGEAAAGESGTGTVNPSGAVGLTGAAAAAVVAAGVAMVLA